jgi:hypothetical protein
MVHGIACDTNEQLAVHIHTHLAVFDHGVLRPVPAGVGVVAPLPQHTPEGPFDLATQCYYWLHVHAQDGVIHVESPTDRTYTLGDFFDVWQQPLTATRVGPAHGRITVYVNGRRYRDDPRTVRLAAHDDVQIDVGTPVVPPEKVDWTHSRL